MMKQITYSYATKNLSMLMDEATQLKEPIAITRVGKDAVILLSHFEFKKLMDLCEHRRIEHRGVQSLDDL